MASSWRAAAAAGAGRGGNFIKDYYNNPTECARALFPFISRQKDELSFNAGDVLEVISRDEGDWWVLRSAAHRVGLAPGNYFELIPPTELIGGDASVVSQPQQQQLASKSKENHFYYCSCALSLFVLFVCSVVNRRNPSQARPSPGLGQRYRSGDGR